MRLRSTAAAVVACLVIAIPAPAFADKTFGGGNSSTGTVFVNASTDPVVATGGRSVCSWTWLTRGQIVGIAPSQGPGLSPEEAAQMAVTDIDGVEYRVYAVVCPDGSDLRLVNPNRPPNFEAAIRDFADELIELPVPNVNPPVDGSGYVNLGMWLAVEESSYAPITASAGPFWMTVTPTPGTTAFEFGNGDSETCDVFGVPIADLDTVEEGPCGYTYGEAGTYTLAATTTWLLPYTSSGGGGALEPMDRTTAVDYTVREIQAVGVGD